MDPSFSKCEDESQFQYCPLTVIFPCIQVLTIHTTFMIFYIPSHYFFFKYFLFKLNHILNKTL